jgi:hypothetical protein
MMGREPLLREPLEEGKEEGSMWFKRRARLEKNQMMSAGGT